MNFSNELKKIKNYLTAFKIRTIALDLILVFVNIFNIHYDGKTVIVKRNRINHRLRIVRKVLIYFMLLYILTYICIACFFTTLRIVMPKYAQSLDKYGYAREFEYIVKLGVPIIFLKLLIVSFPLSHWLKNNNKKLIIILLNDVLKILQKLSKRNIAIDFNNLPPYCNILFHLQFLLIIWNLLNNMRVLYKFEDVLSIIMDFIYDSYYVSLYLMYQIVLLIQWNIHDKLNKNFAKRMARKDFNCKDVLHFITMLRRLKNCQRNFAKNFWWLPSIVVMKAFLIISESFFFWNYIRQHNAMSDIRLIWLYSGAALYWLDIFLLVFMLSELRQLDHCAHQLLFMTVIRQYEATPEQSGTIKELDEYLSSHHFKPYTLYLYPNLQRMNCLLIWSIWWPFLFGFFITCINPINFRFIRSLSQ
ncbi:uncharacterized protein LOC115066383 [Bactrocera dorsalis]|uniref:Uncharacterized protein LOC115066383 n=1 Tax=Bactrocera dorsalis TaxID=27457 RepID=A0A8N4L6P4_BACDO|nr:uncharacterized protein LOC115066383 [Bactrocera dorsalis]